MSQFGINFIHVINISNVATGESDPQFFVPPNSVVSRKICFKHIVTKIVPR